MTGSEYIQAIIRIHGLMQSVLEDEEFMKRPEGMLAAYSMSEQVADLLVKASERIEGEDDLHKEVIREYEGDCDALQAECDRLKSENHRLDGRSVELDAMLDHIKSMRLDAEEHADRTKGTKARSMWTYHMGRKRAANELLAYFDSID